jgi:hypothetical protein
MLTYVTQEVTPELQIKKEQMIFRDIEECYKMLKFPSDISYWETGSRVTKNAKNNNKHNKHYRFSQMFVWRECILHS